MADKNKIDTKTMIRELAALLNETGLSEIEIEEKDLRIRVCKGMSNSHGPVQTVSVPPAATLAATGAPAASTAKPGTVTSPMVGTVYLASEPGARPFIEIGTKVSEGQTLMIVEAMKTMNQISASHAGTVVDILVEDAQPIEFGEPLVIIE